MSSDGQTPLGVVAPGDPVPGPPNPEWDTFLTQVKAIEKKDSNMTSAQQIDRLRKPGSKYLNLNPFYVSIFMDYFFIIFRHYNFKR